MRSATANLREVLQGSFTTRLIVDAFYGATRTLMDIPVASWDLQWNSEANIKSAGKITVVYSDELAKTMTPQKFTDALAPFGQELNLLLEVSAGAFSETVQLGRYRIVAVPNASDSYFELLGQTLVAGSRIELTLEDRMLAVERAGFRSEQNPPSLTSCWAEIARLTGLQVIRSVADKAIPTSIVYAAQQGARLKAVQQLAGVLGGKAYITPDGAVSVLPDAWGAVVGSLVLGSQGTLLDVAYSMESDGVYNEVVGNFTDDAQNPIYSVAQITSGPLDVNGIYGVYTRYYSSPLVKTQAQADSAVAAILAQVSSTQTYRVPVQCVINPTVEDGDVLTVQRPQGGTLTGRVVNHRFGAGGTMSLELEAMRAIA